MRSRHELIDEATVRIGSRLVGENRFFARSVDSPRVEEVLSELSFSVPDVREESTIELSVDTPVGTLDPAVKTWRWIDHRSPTIIYHHGNDERPFSPGRFEPDTFRDIVTAHADRFRANVIAVRAPFHVGTTREYARAMGDLANFVAMLATSVATIDRIIDRLDERSRGAIVVSGVSLGGWVTNLHRTYCGSADAYVPMLAGAALGDTFVDSAYRRLLGVAAENEPNAVRRTLNFAVDFAATGSTELYPLLARYDRYVEYDVQRRCYDGHDVAVVDRGHVTSVLTPGPLREHLVTVLSRVPFTAAVDVRGPENAPTVVLVHGAGISRKLWSPQFDALSDTYRMLAPDLPGHGDRTGEPFEFEGAVDTVDAILHALSADCVVLVGQSLGGYVAIEVAARNPDLVSGLVLSGSSADYRGALGVRTAISSTLFRLGAKSRVVTDRFERNTAKRLRSRPIPTRTVDEILSAGVSLDAWGQSGLALLGRDFPSRLAAYDGPVLLVNGENDRINRPAALRRSAETGAVTPVVIRDAGHTVSLERPETYANVVREFVATHCGGDTASSVENDHEWIE